MQYRIYFMPHTLGFAPKYGGGAFPNGYFLLGLPHTSTSGCVVVGQTDLLTHLNLITNSDVRSLGSDLDRNLDLLLERPNLESFLNTMDFHGDQVLGTGSISVRKVFKRAAITCAIAQHMYFTNSQGYDMLSINYTDNMNLYPAAVKQAFSDACSGFGVPQPDYSQNPTLLSALTEIADTFEDFTLIIYSLNNLTI